MRTTPVRTADGMMGWWDGFMSLSSRGKIAAVWGGGEDSASFLTKPDMVRSGRVLPTTVKSLLFQWNKHPVFHRVRHLFPCFGSLERLLAENFLGNNQSFASLILLCISSVRL